MKASRVARASQESRPPATSHVSPPCMEATESSDRPGGVLMDRACG